MLSQLTHKLCLELQKGKFCYVTGPKPINRPCVEMAQRGYRTLVVSIRKLHNTTQANANWDRQIILSLWRSLHPHHPNQLRKWFKATADLSPKARLIQFAHDWLLNDLCEGPFLICLDNIDGLAHIPGAIADTLDWITYCYQLRDTYLTYCHLSMVIFGSTGLTEKTRFSTTYQPQPIFFNAPAQTYRRSLSSQNSFRMRLSVAS